VKAYRVAQSRYARSADDMLSGEGAVKYSGRWNSVGTPAVYCSESLSLCALEILVHLPRGVLKRYRYLEVVVPDEMIETFDYDEQEDIEVTQQIGDSYLGAEGLLAFTVRSKVNPLERNLVINPEHGYFDQIEYGDIHPFPLDGRLLER
jgi:RES domain-containing protein